MIRPVGLALCVLTSACAPAEPTLQGRASVIDGDTLEIRGARVRVWGVDAPESRQQCWQAGADVACGRIAANRLDQYIDGRTVSCFEQDRDRYGRIVARCEVERADLGEWLVGEGLAIRYARYAGFASVVEETRARRDHKGVWAGVFENPEDWRRAQSGR